MQTAQPRTVTESQRHYCVEQESGVDSSRNIRFVSVQAGTKLVGDMALRNEIKTEIAREIEEQLAAALRQTGFGKLLSWIRNRIGAAAAITVILFVLGLTVKFGFAAFYRGQKDARFQQETADFESDTNQKLTKIENHLSNLENAILALRTTQAASNPTSKASIVEAKKALSEARKNSVHLPATVVEQSGTRFVDAASKEPAAWDAALRFLDYRSFLNAASAPSPPSHRPAEWEAYYEFRAGEPLPGHPSMTITGLVPRDQAAITEPLGRSLLPPSTTVAPHFLILENASVWIDGTRFKNVIFRDSRIRYDGGPVEMENVYFVNCTFEFKHAPNSIRLSKTVLASSATTFKSVG